MIVSYDSSFFKPNFKNYRTSRAAILLPFVKERLGDSELDLKIKLWVIFNLYVYILVMITKIIHFSFAFKKIASNSVIKNKEEIKQWLFESKFHLEGYQPFKNELKNG